MGGSCSTYGREKRSMLGGNLRKRSPLEEPGVDGTIIFRWIFRQWDVGSWTGLIWLRIWTGGQHF